MKALSFWRIAADAPEYSADSLSGKGAELTGARWNRPGTPLLYCAPSRALACLETLVHLTGEVRLPLNRYLVELQIPPRLWQHRTLFNEALNVGWDAEPAGLVSLDWGTRWARSGASLLAEVPSVIVPEERNLLLNPAHRDIKLVASRKIRRWHYDFRLTSPPEEATPYRRR